MASCFHRTGDVFPLAPDRGTTPSFPTQVIAGQSSSTASKFEIEAWILPHARWYVFVLPTFRMALQPHVVFPALHCATQNGVAFLLPATTVTSDFNEESKWDTH